MPQKVQSLSFWSFSFKLWQYFFGLIFKRLKHYRSPSNVDSNEDLGRALFSGNYNHKRGIIKASAFLQKPNHGRGLSVNRVSCAPISLFTSLSNLDAAARSIRSGNEITFYGFATLNAESVRKIKDQTSNTSLLVSGSPTIKNPLHAEIILPPYKDKSDDLYFADQLLKISDPP